MGIEWFRDLSIIILCFVTIAALIFASIIIYRLYRKIITTLVLIQKLLNSVNNTVNIVETVIKTTSQNINDTVTEVKDSIKMVSNSIGDAVSQVQECIEQLFSIPALIKGICDGIGNIKNMFKKQSNEGGNNNE